MNAPPTPTLTGSAQGMAATSPRLHVAAALAQGSTVMLTEAQAHYLLTVLRRTPGDEVRLFNGADGEFLGSIGTTKRDGCQVQVGALLRPQVPEGDTWLLFALLKRSPTEMVVQKATELGVAAILPVFTTRTNADRTNVTRLRSIAMEAAEQSERLTVPGVQEPRALGAVLAQWPQERRLVACLERADATPVRPRESGPDALLVGPEGGFTPSELDALRACPFVEAATLGRRILRAETAAIVGLSRLQAD